ncbi:MAG: hypothetical protein NC095_04275 [Muribaculum sp.]|nr:hypothetical protein [Muribaculum sp.]
MIAIDRVTHREVGLHLELLPFQRGMAEGNWTLTIVFIKQGVDSARKMFDYYGTFTLNSLAKMRNVYGQDSIIAISQKYHNERSFYQAKHLGIDTIGYLLVELN